MNRRILQSLALSVCLGACSAEIAEPTPGAESAAAEEASTDGLIEQEHSLTDWVTLSEVDALGVSAAISARPSDIAIDPLFYRNTVVEAFAAGAIRGSAPASEVSWDIGVEGTYFQPPLRVTLVTEEALAEGAIVVGDGFSDGVRALPVVSRSEQAVVVELDRASSVSLVVPRSAGAFAAVIEDEGWRVPVDQLGAPLTVPTDESPLPEGAKAVENLRILVKGAPVGTICGEVEGLGVTVLSPVTANQYVGYVPVDFPATFRWRVFGSDSPDCSTNDGNLYPDSGLLMQAGNTSYMQPGWCDEGPVGEFWYAADGAWRWGITTTGADTCPSSTTSSIPVEYRLYNLQQPLVAGEFACLQLLGEAPAPVSLSTWRYSLTLPQVITGNSNFRWFVSTDSDCSSIDREIGRDDAWFALAGYPVGDSCVFEAGTGDAYFAAEVSAGPTITPNGAACSSGPSGEPVQFQARGTAPSGMHVCVETEGGETGLLEPFGADRFIGSLTLDVPATVRWRTFASSNSDCSTNEGLLYPGPNLDMQVANTPFYNSSQCVTEGGQSWLETDFASRWSATITSSDTCPGSDLALATRVEFRAYNLQQTLTPTETMCLEFSGVAGVPVPLQSWRYTTTIPILLPTDLTFRWYVSNDTGCSTVDRILMPGDAFIALSGLPVTGDTCVVDAGTSELFLRATVAEGPSVTSSGTLACVGCTGDECTEDICDDGIDNDGDEAVDCADPDCDGVGICGPEICDDSEDNDGDGDSDCGDADCAGSFACSSCVSSGQLEGFEGIFWPNGVWTQADPAGGVGSSTFSQAFAGAISLFDLSTDAPQTWFYRTDVTFTPGSVLRMRVRANGASIAPEQRAFLGFGASAAGAHSMGAFWDDPETLGFSIHGDWATDASTLVDSAGTAGLPTDEWVTIQVRASSTRTATFEVFDASGALVDAFDHTYAAGEFPLGGVAWRPLNDMWVDEVELTCWVPEVCNDGADNDADFSVDCADADCAADPACAL